MRQAEGFLFGSEGHAGRRILPAVQKKWYKKRNQSKIERERRLKLTGFRGYAGDGRRL